MSGAVPFKLAPDATGEEAPWSGGMPPLATQQLWFSLQRLEWAALVIVPADAEGSGMDFARPLYEVGKLAMGDRLRLLDARNAKLNAIAPLILDMTGAAPRAAVAYGERVLVVIDSVISSPSGIPVALAADAALLGVEIGKSSLASAQETLQILGPGRFVGCVTLPPK